MNKKIKKENKIFEEVRIALEDAWESYIGERREYTDAEVSNAMYINNGLTKEEFIDKHINLIDTNKIYEFINSNNINFNDLEEEAIYNIVSRQITNIVVKYAEYIYSSYKSNYVNYIVNRVTCGDITEELDLTINENLDLILEGIAAEVKDMDRLEKELEDNRDYITEKVLEKFGEEIETKATDIDDTIKYFGDMVIRVILTNYTANALATIDNTKTTIKDYINATIDIIEQTP